MKKLFLFALMAIGVSCSNDSNENEDVIFDGGCYCTIYDPSTQQRLPSDQTNCELNGTIESLEKGTIWVCY